MLTKKMIYGLYKPKSYVFTSNRFKKRSEFEAEQAERIAKDGKVQILLNFSFSLFEVTIKLVNIFILPVNPIFIETVI